MTNMHVKSHFGGCYKRGHPSRVTLQGALVSLRGFKKENKMQSNAFWMVW